MRGIGMSCTRSREIGSPSDVSAAMPLRIEASDIQKYCDCAVLAGRAASVRFGLFGVAGLKRGERRLWVVWEKV
jgi:hypothetical protein